MMRRPGLALWVMVTLILTAIAIPLRADDTVLFTANVAPDALFLFDLSRSMLSPPAGENLWASSCGTPPYYATSGPGHTTSCDFDNAYYWGDSACVGPFYNSSGSGHTRDCSKLLVAKQALFDILDDNDGGVITKADEDSLNIRIGYMRFTACSKEDPTIDYNVGCATLRRGFDFNYSSLYDNFIKNETSGGYTPLASLLKEGKKYLDDHKATDSAKACRKKFLVLVTDGFDTLSCGGPDSSGYKRRRATVAAVKEAVEAGYQVFAIGFGADMPQKDKYTLEWVAFKGGTNNPLSPDSGDTSAITFSPDPCAEYTGCTPDQANCTNAPNDPGYAPLSGYALLASDPAALREAMKAVIKIIREKAFSFTAATVPSLRLTESERVFVSSFSPNTTPFWRGDLKAYVLNPDGTLPVDGYGIPTQPPVWEAQKILRDTSPDDRKIYTYKSGSRVEFKYDNLTNGELGLSTDTERDQLIKHVRGYDPWDIDQDGNTTESRTYKLGDIFHSQAVIVGAPSSSFVDSGYSGTAGFYDTRKNRTKVILAGANDGMLHAFDVATGAERWAFIPPDLLKSLKTMKTRWDQYKSSGSSGVHLYHVDTSPRVSDVWFYSSTDDTTKSVDEWRTVLIAGLRKGGNTYFALDITDTTDPVFLWQFPKATDTTTLNKMGQSWSEPSVTRIKIDVGGQVVERWVAFIGGGYRLNAADPEGRYLFVVDIKTGDIIREFSGFLAPIPAAPLAVDTTTDGYADRVYVGDEEGRMYVMYISDANPTNWTRSQLLQAPATESGKHPIYYAPAVAFDSSGTPWVYFGTGDREDPASNTKERFYAVKDNKQGTYPRVVGDLVDVTSNPSTFTPVPADKYGWTMRLTDKEKVLSRPLVFNRLVYFTTYSPNESDTDVCTTGGTARLYVSEYLSGGGALLVDDEADLTGGTTARSKVIGSGVPSAPVITMNADGQATIIIGTTESQIYSGKIFSPEKNKHILYWREVFD